MAEPDLSTGELILASASPRRRELLALVDLHPQVLPPDIDETPQTGEHHLAYVDRIAAAKAAAVPRMTRTTRTTQATCATRADDTIVVAADTTVVIDDRILGKPADAGEAAAMLAQLSGRTHLVITGVAVLGRHDTLHTTTVTTHVRMTTLSPARIAAYVATDEPLGKAGAYAIQGRGAALVERIEGSWTNVVGLPVVETLALLREAGLPVP